MTRPGLRPGLRPGVRRGLMLIVAVLVAALTLGGCGFSVYSLPLPGGTDVGKNPITITVQFQDVLDLVPDSTVKVNDVSVGNVKHIDLEHGIAVVTVQLRNDTKLPANATAQIQQTSLLGEKFVNLSTPDDPSSQLLANGDTIPLARTGTNPQIEEVLGALSLVLNGGGVAQLKTISTELNKALSGHEDAARSVITQVNTLVSNLDSNKQSIVDALDKLDTLTRTVRSQEKTIDATLDELPAAVRSIDGQRKQLVTMLRALDRLGKTGTRVILASKTNTIAVIRDLEPTLTELAVSGDHFVNSFNTLLTYPFVDASVGGTPAVARNLHIGDYVNLDITLDLDLSSLSQLPGVGSTVCLPLSVLQQQLGKVKGLGDLLSITTGRICDGPLKTNLDACQQALEQQLTNGSLLQSIPKSCAALPGNIVGLLQGLLGSTTGQLCTAVPLLGTLGLCPGSGGGGGGGGGSSPSASSSGLLGGLLGGLSGGLGGGSPRAPESLTPDGRVQSVSLRQLDDYYDPTLVSLMVPGLDTTGGSGR